MSEEINVVVIDRGRKNLYLRYTDPVTGQRVEKSARTASKREAVKTAGEWQSELKNGQGSTNSRLRWDVFREAYEDYVASHLSPGTLEKVNASFNVIERTMKPDNVRRIQPQWISRLQTALLNSGRKPTTVASYCRHLQAAMNWAAEEKLISSVPRFRKLKKARKVKLMKGRPVTGEEFDRMWDAINEHLPTAQQASVKMLMRGLWLSGLRLGEALCLTWDQWADGIRVDMSGEYVKLLIPAESEKGGKDRVYPVTPDFAVFLQAVPIDQRTGFVFNMLHQRLQVTRRIDTASKQIADLGRLANVKVDQQGDKASYATAHDLRRAFGQRWSRKVPPMVLKELMRHECVSTTEKYYVDIDADSTAAMLSGLLIPQGDTSGDTRQKPLQAIAIESAKTLPEAGLEPAREINPTGF